MLCTHWIISFNLHKVATITTYKLWRTKPSSKRWNKLTKVTFVNGGGQDLNQETYASRLHDLHLWTPWLQPWYSPSPSSFYEILTLAISSLSTPLNGGQLLWVLFSWRTTDVSKNLIRKREKRRWQTQQNPTVVLHPFTLPTWLLPLWLESLPKILIFIQTALKTSKLENDKISLKEWGMKLQNSRFLASPTVVCMQIPETGHQPLSPFFSGWWLHHYTVEDRSSEQF